MRARSRRWTEALRISWAIAAKDIVDAIKNKTTLSLILTALFLILFYRWLPSLESGQARAGLAVYDAGGSQLMTALRESSQIDLVEVPTEERMKWYVADKDAVILGLVLPAGLDQALASGAEVELDGYVVHWASDAAAQQKRAFFQDQLSELARRPLRISIEGHTVYTLPDSRGMAFLVSVTLVMASLTVGAILVPHLVIEEKQAKTMEALLVSPAGTGHLLAGKALAGLFYCLSAVGVVLALNTGIITHWGLAVVATLCGSLLAVALGLLLGSLLEVRQQMTIGAFVVFIPLLIPVFLSIEPQLVPAGLQTVLPYIPTVAAARAVRVSFCEHAPLGLYAAQLAIVLGWAALILGGVAWAVRRSDR